MVHFIFQLHKKTDFNFAKFIVTYGENDQQAGKLWIHGSKNRKELPLFRKHFFLFVFCKNTYNLYKYQ